MHFYCIFNVSTMYLKCTHMAFSERHKRKKSAINADFEVAQPGIEPGSKV